MIRSKLLAMVALAILFAQLQCVAACAGEGCSAISAHTESAPPCHRHHAPSHHQRPGSCAHDQFVMAADAAPAASLGAPALSNVAISPGPQAVFPEAPARLAFDPAVLFPPGLQRFPNTVLRI